jgi:3-dehydroquinate synthase
MPKQEIIISKDFESDLRAVIDQQSYDSLYILTDDHTRKSCQPRIQKILDTLHAYSITVASSDLNKNLDSLISIWTALSTNGASRHSLLINLGGGVITDMGGFAASTFKRGICYINVPTTLLAMVDASVGGKTGINFNGLKNEIGVFNPASVVILETDFLRTLDRENLLSGYGEMIKHGLISNEAHWADLLKFDFDNPDFEYLKILAGESVRVKEEVVAKDPFEQGIRKSLNLGHTVGHAFESLSFTENAPILHGYAVAWGLVCELFLSVTHAGFPQDKMRQTVNYIKDNYGVFAIDCNKYNQLYDLMKHDKKNIGGVINFTLLKEIGEVQVNQTASKKEIFEMFDFYRECMGL